MSGSETRQPRTTIELPPMDVSVCFKVAILSAECGVAHSGKDREIAKLSGYSTRQGCY
jgi:hypothetical protein